MLVRRVQRGGGLVGVELRDDLCPWRQQPRAQAAESVEEVDPFSSGSLTHATSFNHALSHPPNTSIQHSLSHPPNTSIELTSTWAKLNPHPRTKTITLSDHSHPIIISTHHLSIHSQPSHPIIVSTHHLSNHSHKSTQGLTVRHTKALDTH